MRLRFVVVTAMVTASFALAGCGSSSSSGGSHAQSASTKHTAASTPVSIFAAHAGLAFGTFYRLIYNPYRAGAFSDTANDRAAFTRAAAAAAYVASQLDQATAAARTSASLSKVIGPLEVLDAGFHSALTKLRAGQFKMSEIQAADLAISAIKGSATIAGVPIGESS